MNGNQSGEQVTESEREREGERAREMRTYCGGIYAPPSLPLSLFMPHPLSP
jgi:hypothetical protein